MLDLFVYLFLSDDFFSTKLLLTNIFLSLVNSLAADVIFLSSLSF